MITTICKTCEARIQRLRLNFSVTYSTEVYVQANNRYSAILSTLRLESSTLDDEDTIEAQCILCDAIGPINDIYHTIVGCDFCGSQLPNHADYYCRVTAETICSECADKRLPDKCKWCDYTYTCALYKAFKNREEEREEVDNE